MFTYGQTLADELLEEQKESFNNISNIDLDYIQRELELCKTCLPPNQIFVYEDTYQKVLPKRLWHKYNSMATFDKTFGDRKAVKYNVKTQEIV